MRGGAAQLHGIGQCHPCLSGLCMMHLRIDISTSLRLSSTNTTDSNRDTDKRYLLQTTFLPIVPSLHHKVSCHQSKWMRYRSSRAKPHHPPTPFIHTSPHHTTPHHQPVLLHTFTVFSYQVCIDYRPLVNIPVPSPMPSCPPRVQKSCFRSGTWWSSSSSAPFSSLAKPPSSGSCSHQPGHQAPPAAKPSRDQITTILILTNITSPNREPHKHTLA
ncbi:hypothetical protein QBC44DRAFT_328839 [Cladorrhinum sp. PSN332]|nr:hypothetical protein QBC44DRAFT_328839 [Cladorrhinum sp. PSN332]